MSTDSFLKRLTDAIIYLTIFPSPASKKDVSASVSYFPLVGFLLGCFLWICFSLFKETFPLPLTALFLLSILIIVTRGFSLDGLASFLDGLGSGKEGKKMITIMRERSRGTFGLIGLILAILAKYLLISQLIEAGSVRFLLFFPTVGGWSMVCLTWAFPITQHRSSISYPTSRDFWWATSITLLCVIFTQGLVGVGIMVLIWIFIYIFGYYVVKKIGGITPHIMGGCGEFVEIISLSFLVALLGSR
ncbi:MAG: adenosylcobinamide-GDP ribazoletransferase [Deltaproteobacteria bacterium]|nr:adenosylcobinamide-GDP ribazoletransferase [Deltaproteobacteria bacterium]